MSDDQPSVIGPGQIVDFALHSLGWKAFQDLCLTIAGEVFGQTVQQFAPTHDAGRDAAFHGTWENEKGIKLSGSFTIQCKHTSKASNSIAASDLRSEIHKVTSLAKRGLADNYIFITNHTVSGEAHLSIERAFLGIPGVKTFHLFEKGWICRQITENSRLRLLVPRVYGLGDLSQIFDERAYQQASAVLASLGDDFNKFVITSAYRKSAEALRRKGFVLLIGEPASGKSTIAAALSIGAIDNWKCRPLKVRNEKEFLDHWNPNDAKQFFWIDDVFGATQYQRDRALEWNSAFKPLATAIKNGAKVVFTSRDYIYKWAQCDLKISAFPILDDSQVIINVHELSEGERSQMLYNHIKLGTQPQSVKTRLKPLLPIVVNSKGFLPETCKRLGTPIFTKELSFSIEGIRKFVEQPLPFLVEVIRSIDDASRAALALLFMRGGWLASPLSMSNSEEQQIRRMAPSLSALLKALESMNGSLVLLQSADGQHGWTFRHPTIRDAIGTIVSESPELLEVYLIGVKPEEIVSEVICGEVELQGARVRVPMSCYSMIIEKIRDNLKKKQIYSFLATRCDKIFLEAYIAADPNLINARLDELSELELPSDSFLRMLSRINEFQLLDEQYKRRLFDIACELIVVNEPDIRYLTDDIRSIFQESEIEILRDLLRTKVIGRVDWYISHWRYSVHVSPKPSPEERFQFLSDILDFGEIEFEDDTDTIAEIVRAKEELEETINEMNEDYHEPDEVRELYHESRNLESTRIERDIFDDVDV